jgi:hypothetical protein
VFANIQFGTAVATFSGFTPGAQNSRNLNGSVSPFELTREPGLPDGHARSVPCGTRRSDDFTDESLGHITFSGYPVPFTLPVKYIGPVLIRFFDVAGHIFHPEFLNFLIIVKIKLAFDNRPRLRINVRRGATADGISSVTAVLWHILFRCVFK